MRRRIKGVLDESSMMRGSRLDVTREGHWVTHKARYELDRRNNLFSQFVARNGCLENSKDAGRN